MNTYLKEDEALRLKELAEDLEILRRMSRAMHAEAARIKARATTRRHAAELKARRAKDRAEMAEFRCEGAV